MIKKTPALVWWFSLLLFIYGVMLGGLQLVIGDIAQNFGVGLLGIGSLAAVMHVASATAPALMGIVADRIGKKKILVAFSFVFGLGCLLAGSAPSLIFYMVSTLFIGAGYSVCESIISALCVELDEEKGASYVNLTQCLLSTGAIVSPIVLAKIPVMSIPTWRLMFWFCAVCLVIMGLILVTKHFPAGIPAAKKKSPISRNLLLSPIFLALLISIFLYIGLEKGFGYFVELLFEKKTSGEKLAAYGISVYWAGMALSRLVFGLVSYRPRRVVRLCLLGCALGFVGLATLASGSACVAMCALVGITHGPVWTTLVAGAAERFPQYRASATGLMSAGGGLAGITYPIIIGAIANGMGLQAGFLLLAATCVIGAVLAFALHNKKPEKVSP